MRVYCPECQKIEELTPARWRCDCGAAWEPHPAVEIRYSTIHKEVRSLWRYIDLFELEMREPFVQMGEGWTPLILQKIAHRDVYLKLDYFAPTFSFKDRGTSVMINVLKQQGVRKVVDDSSGNAGASLAAYAALAGIEAHIFIPHYASSAKRAQIGIYGAELHIVDGTRAETKKAAMNFASGDAIYASHAYHPGFFLGQMTMAWEIWEQSGFRAPDWYISPVGQGLQLLGVWQGFVRLYQAGLVKKIPRLVAVQPQRCAPLVYAYNSGLQDVPPIESTQPSVAEGLAISAPVRGRSLLQAIRETQGLCIQVSEEEILHGQMQLAHNGIYVEPTSATIVPAINHVLERADNDQVIVAGLTGSGLKGIPKLK